MRLRPNPSMALSEYVYYAFSRPSVVSGIEDLNTATANPHINLGILAAIEFPVPSLEIQRAICVDLAAAYDLSAALQAEIESLLAFRSVLLSQLLTNKIGLPETYDSLLEVVA
jgi:restriction endonuclease S subunit